MRDQEHVGWRDYLGLYSDGFGVIGGLMLMVTLVLWEGISYRGPHCSSLPLLVAHFLPYG